MCKYVLQKSKLQLKLILYLSSTPRKIPCTCYLVNCLLPLLFLLLRLLLRRHFSFLFFSNVNSPTSSSFLFLIVASSFLLCLSLLLLPQRRHFLTVFSQDVIHSDDRLCWPWCFSLTGNVSGQFSPTDCWGHVQVSSLYTAPKIADRAAFRQQINGFKIEAELVDILSFSGRWWNLPLSRSWSLF